MFYRRNAPRGQEETVMAMQQIEPVGVDVSTHWRIEAFDDSWRTLPFDATIAAAGGVLVSA